MIDKMRNRMQSEEGFTLIELLVVILIIGILAAIAIPSFLNQREKGQDACAKSQARTMMTAIETRYTDFNSYSANMAELNQIESAITGSGACGAGTTATVGGTNGGANGICSGVGDAQNFCVSQTSATTTVFSIVKTAGGTPARNCTPAARQGEGGCPSSGTW